MCEKNIYIFKILSYLPNLIFDKWVCD